jgi:N-acetyl-anhydromuramyl-L-alanine amidase AmpD
MTYPIIRSKYYTPGRNGVKPRLIVVHTMETPENRGRAFQVATWFASPSSPQASAHYCVDDAEVYNTVLEADTAWAVDDFPLNQASISIEHAGSASQTPAQWDDHYSNAELTVSAKLAAGIAKRYGIPLVKLTAADVLAGKSGFIGHVDVTTAKKVPGGHTDPGPNFPWTKYLALVKENS